MIELMNRLVLALLMLAMVAAPASWAQYTTYSQQSTTTTTTPYQGAPLQGRVVSVPAGTPVDVTLRSSIGSNSSRPGDRVVVMVDHPVTQGGVVVLPAGSTIEGIVSDARDAGMMGGHGKLDVQFDRAYAPDGQPLALSAHIYGVNGDDTTIRGGSTKSRVGSVAGRTLGTAAVGSLVGLGIGGILGGKSGLGRGAAMGAIAGGGGGLISSMYSRGNEVVIPAGQPIRLILDSAVVAPASY